MNHKSTPKLIPNLQTENNLPDSFVYALRPVHWQIQSNVITYKYLQCYCHRGSCHCHSDGTTPKCVHEQFQVCAYQAPATSHHTDTAIRSEIFVFRREKRNCEVFDSNEMILL